MRGAELFNMDIHGEVWNLRINGVDVAPLVEAELDRRHPDRAKMRPTDPDGFREAWDIVERLWDDTVARARRLDPQLLHESVDGEWSFIQTLRHLVFATDAWIRRVRLGDPSPWDPLDLPFDQMKDQPSRRGQGGGTGSPGRRRGEAALRQRSGTWLAEWGSLSEVELDLLLELLGVVKADDDMVRAGVTSDGRWRVTTRSGSSPASRRHPRGAATAVRTARAVISSR